MIKLPFHAPRLNRTRRGLLQVAAALPALCIAGKVAAQPAVAVGNRSISLVSTHTGESLLARYFVAGQYVGGALTQLNTLLRDHRSGDTHPIDPQLFDLLHQVAVDAGQEPHYEVISGYRSPVTNGKLHARSKGVARHSLHMDGKAIDVRLVGAPCGQLRDLAMGLNVGGVGYYKQSNFVHLDTGRVRYWAG
jgi:uncharacterized protein YcbK (DUF882 family)